MSTPKVVDHGLPAPDPEHPNVPFAAVPAAPEMPQISAHGAANDQMVSDHLSLFLADHLSPSAFIRPPPEL